MPSAVSSPTLLIMTSLVVSDPSLVQRLLAPYASHTEFTHHILDRIIGGQVKLNDDYYSNIILVNNPSNQTVNLDSNTLEILNKALAPQGDFSGSVDFRGQLLDAIMAGFIENNSVNGDNSWSKPASYSSTSPNDRSGVTSIGSVSLKPQRLTGGSTALPKFKKLTNANNKRPASQSINTNTSNSTVNNNNGTPTSLSSNTTTTIIDPSAGVVKLSLNDDNDFNMQDDDEDDLIDDDELLDDSVDFTSFAKPIITLPVKCDPGPGKKRRKACKDCTCGLKELEGQLEDEQRQQQDAILSLNNSISSLNANLKINPAPTLPDFNDSTVVLSTDDMAEVDFTSEGKVGGCGSCALGDAFRCDGCPYIGLPPFKPGEIVSISALAGGDDF
ncbi:DUF689-domain-containing protein [Nadsonia fulvescens var. elongata DSM 6958]|uniref:DUF689-domain-containing protein n=1 Tax=Nadsonia fulvescens var. elongata DSM 6958 TaxID=857566 RepID=A0A1E3PPC7_9ASCO|nr:DUF689-domain-containing protein [Nadsonia fulvescens var. elongata DSM 6958]